MNDIPRRIRVDLMTRAELAIRDAALEVERAGAHPLLTDAVVLLQQAREKVADFVEGAPGGPKCCVRTDAAGDCSCCWRWRRWAALPASPTVGSGHSAAAACSPQDVSGPHGGHA